MKLSEVPPPPPKLSGYDCVFGAVNEKLDDDDRATLAAWLTNPSASDAWVADRLTEATGLAVNHQNVARHRREQCIRCRDSGRVWL